MKCSKSAQVHGLMPNILNQERLALRGHGAVVAAAEDLLDRLDRDDAQAAQADGVPRSTPWRGALSVHMKLRGPSNAEVLS